MDFCNYIVMLGILTVLGNFEKDQESNGVFCWAKLMEKKRTENLMEMLGLKETVVQMAKANGVRWYGHVLGRNDGHVLRKALKFEVKGTKKQGRPKKTWNMQVEKESLELSKMEIWIWKDCC